MKNLKIHAAAVNALCLICTVFACLVSSKHLSIEAKYDAWLLYIIDIAFPMIGIVKMCYAEFGIHLNDDSDDRATIDGIALLFWAVPIFIASSSCVLPLVGNLFARSWVLGLVCGIPLAISILLCLGNNIVNFIDSTEYIISSRLQIAIPVCILIASALFLLRSIWLFQGELNDYPFVLLSALYALSSILYFYAIIDF